MSESPSEQAPDSTQATTPAPTPKGGGLKRVAKGLGIAAVVVLLIGRAALPDIIKGQIETKGTAALGVPVTLDDVSLSITGGKVKLSQFAIAQPDGFGTGAFFSADELAVEVSIRSLMGDVIEVEEISAVKPALVLAKNAAGKANFEAIQANAEKSAGGKGKDGSADGSSGEAKAKGVMLGELDVKDFALVLRGQGEESVTIRFERYKLENVEFVPGSTEEKPFESKLKGFAIEGPGKGFSAQGPISVEALKFEADLNSLISKKPRIKKVELTGPTIRAERNAAGQVNYMEVARIAQSFAPAAGEPGGTPAATEPAGQGGGDGKSESAPPQDVAIDEVLVHNVDVSLTDAQKGTLSYRQAEFALRGIRISPDATPAPFTMEASGIEVAGPGKGFATQKPFELERFALAADMNSCMAENPVITSIQITKPIIRQEENAEGAKNFDALTDVGLAFAPPPKDETGSGAGTQGSGGDGKGGGSESPAPYRLDSFELSGGVFEMMMPGGPEGTETFRITGIGLDMRDLASPAPKDKPGQMTLRMNPLAEDSRLAVKLLGNVGTHVIEERDITYTVDLKNFPLDTVSRLKPGEQGFKSGRLDTIVEGSLKQSKIDSKIELVGRDLALESGKSGRGGKKSGGLLGGLSMGMLNSAIDTLQKPGTKETVPIRFKLSMDYRWMSPEERRTAIRKAIQDGITDAIANAAGLKAEALAKGVGDAVKDAGGIASDAVKGAGGVVKDAGSAAGSAVKGVGDAVGGLFGGGKKEEKKP